jgi:hypothetical protein
MALDLGIFLEGAQSTFKVKVSENDAQAQYLIDKLISSDGSVTITETNDGGIETIDLTTSGGGGISSPLTTKGDLFTYSTTDDRLGVGSDGQALIADSAEATGLKWGTVSADNMATANLTLTGDRTHDLDGNVLKFDNGQVTIEGSGATNATTSILIQNSTATQLLKIDDEGGFALGSGATYGNNECVAIGLNADATDNSSPSTSNLISIGANSSANGSGSITIGESGSSNAQSTSVGFSSSSSFSSTAIGYNANASNTGTAVGHSANSSNTRAIAIGNSATSSRFGSIAIGYTANAGTSGSYSMALGAGSNVSASNAILISAKGTTQTNSTANTFEVNLNNTTSVFRFGNTVDGWLNSTGNFAIGSSTPNSKLDIAGDIAITDGITAPTATVGKAKIYVDTADGDLKIVFGDGTVKTIVTDS